MGLGEKTASLPLFRIPHFTSLVPRPCPAFRHLQYGFSVLQATESWVGPGNGKLGGAWERKAGWGLGTRLAFYSVPVQGQSRVATPRSAREREGVW